MKSAALDKCAGDMEEDFEKMTMNAEVKKMSIRKPTGNTDLWLQMIGFPKGLDQSNRSIKSVRNKTTIKEAGKEI